jgi:hypothetical protein
MTREAFAWDTFESAYGNGAQVPARLLELRSVQDLDLIQQVLGELAVYGVDNGYLTVAAGPLTALLLEEALQAMTEARPAWPYLVHVFSGLGIGRTRIGLPRTRFSSPHESETERIQAYSLYVQRQSEVEAAVALRWSRMFDALQSAPLRDSVYCVGVASLAGALRDEHMAAVAALYTRSETDGQRASLLLAAPAHASHPTMKTLFDAASAADSVYLRAAAWCGGVSTGQAGAATVREVEQYVAAADQSDEELIWYGGLLAGVVCQAVATSTLARESKLEIFFRCLERTPGEWPLFVSAAAAAAWEIFVLVLGRHYQSRRPLWRLDFNAEELGALAKLRASTTNWLESGHAFPSQFGIFNFDMTIDALLDPPAPLARILRESWPGELHPSPLGSALQRPLVFPSASQGRRAAFTVLARCLMSELDQAELASTLRCTLQLPGYPCRELVLAIERAQRDNGEDPKHPVVSDLASFRRAVEGWASEPLLAALCELFAARTGVRSAVG